MSVDSQGVQGNTDSRGSWISADGRYVAFFSFANNLVGGDTNSRSDAFVRDRVSGTTERVSVDSAGTQGNDNSFARSISADGRYVVIGSSASNLVPGDTNGWQDVFVRDRQSATTERVSVDSAGAQANRESFSPSISADGRYVVFISTATNLVSGDTNESPDVFVHDRQSGTTERVNVDSAGVEANGASFEVSISADGRYVAFGSYAVNLVGGDTNAELDVFVRDRQNGTTERVSLGSAGAQANRGCFSPSIAADGSHVAFYTSADTLVSGDTNATWDVFVHDRQSGTTERVSVDSAGVQGNGSSRVPSLSPDGRYVAFQSAASNLVPGDTNGWEDVFVRDRELGTTERSSVDSVGAQGNFASSIPSLSADVRYVAFISSATNLVSGDTNDREDVFVRDRSGGSCATLHFETEDDFVTPLVNGQHIDVEFGARVTLTSAGPNAGMGIFDSTPGGPNDPGQDPDLLVDSGNLLVLQTENFPPDANDVFPAPNDDEDGGTVRFTFPGPIQARSVRLVDLDAGDGTSHVRLSDASGRARTYSVPGDWTGDRTLAQPGHGTLDLLTLAPQPGFGSVATVSEAAGFDARAVLQIDVELAGSGGIDDLLWCSPGASFSHASAAVRNGTGVNPLVLSNPSPPVLGGTWGAHLDCTGHASGFASLLVKSAPLVLPTAYGELLVGGTRLLQRVRPHSGSAVSFTEAIPPDPSLLGVTACAQGVCTGGGVSLTNALDLVLGY